MNKLTNLFDPAALKRAEREANAFKSRTTLIWLTPREFLKLTPTVENPNTDYYDNMLSQGEKIQQIPFLKTEQRGSIFEVFGHEGRHRCRAITKKNLRGTIPVLLTDSTTRWEEDNMLGKEITLRAQEGAYKHKVTLPRG